MFALITVCGTRHMWGVWHLQMNVKYITVCLTLLDFFNGFRHCSLFCPVMRCIWQSDWSVMSGPLAVCVYEGTVDLCTGTTSSRLTGRHLKAIRSHCHWVWARWGKGFEIVETWKSNKYALFIYLLSGQWTTIHSMHLSTQKCPPQTPYHRIDIHDSALGVHLKTCVYFLHVR